MTTSRIGFLIIWLIISAGLGMLLIFKTDAMQNLYLKIMCRAPKLGSKSIISPDYVGSPLYASQMRIAGALIWCMDVFVLWALFFAR